MAIALSGQLPKHYRLGTHRCRDPAATLARVADAMPAMGITRVASMTGLDYIGIPACVAVRPNSRSVSVAQGKGVSVEAAAASAVMEAAEVFHAEAIEDRARLASLAEIEACGEYAAFGDLNRTAKRRSRRMRIKWIEGQEIGAARSCWVPLELVSTDYRLSRAPGTGLFLASTNGLASGNHPIEAVISGICEVIERDATTLWRRHSWTGRGACRLDSDSADDPTCQALIETFRRARMAVQLWDVTSNLGVAAFHCRITETPKNQRPRVGAFFGSGCHPDRRIALTRALTEAAQSRLTHIAGARDDLDPEDYAEVEAQDVWDALLDLKPAKRATRQFGTVPSFESDDLRLDLAWLRERLAAAGYHEVIAVDLTRPDLGMPVVRVIVPGLEGPSYHPDYVPGSRAGALAH
jgi:ribosomal protein S12 methylthiotransferase accessory factor